MISKSVFVEIIPQCDRQTDRQTSPYLTLPYRSGVLPHNNDTSSGPNAH